MRYLFPVFILLITYFNAQAQMSGPIAFVNENVSSTGFRTIDDSVVFMYHNGRGGTITDLTGTGSSATYAGVLKYDTAKDYVSSMSGSQEDMICQTFDASDNILTKTVRYWNPSTWTYDLKSRDSMNYNTNNNLTSTHSFDNTKMLTQIFYTYNSSNQLIKEEHYGLWSSTMGPKKLIEYSYTGSNVSVKMQQNWDPSKGAYYYYQCHYYRYTTGGELEADSFETYNVTMSQWNFNNITTYTYNTSGKIASATTQRNLLSGIENWNRTLYTYNTSPSYMLEDLQAWSTSLSAWQHNRYNKTSYNSAGKKVMYEQDYTTGYSADYGRYIFDWSNTPFPLLNSRRRDVWDGSNFVQAKPDNLLRIYYSGLLWPAAITTAPSIATIKVYPIPAVSFCTIDISMQNTESVKIALYNMTGKLLYQIGKAGEKNYTVSVPVTELPAGMYLVSIEQGKQQTVRKIEVVH